jgi:hypothetical protein
MASSQLTVSELAVLRAVDQGASSADEIQRMTGAAKWWINLTIWGLVNVEGLLRHGVQGLQRTRGT